MPLNEDMRLADKTESGHAIDNAIMVIIIAFSK